MSKVKNPAWMWRGWFLVEMPVLHRGSEGYWRMLKEAEIFFRFFSNALPRYGSFHQVMPSLRVQRLGTGAGRIDTFMTRSNHMSYKSPTCLSSWSVICMCVLSSSLITFFDSEAFWHSAKQKKGSWTVKGCEKPDKRTFCQHTATKSKKTAHTCHVLHHANHVRCIKQS